MMYYATNRVIGRRYESAYTLRHYEKHGADRPLHIAIQQIETSRPIT